MGKRTIILCTGEGNDNSWKLMTRIPSFIQIVIGKSFASIQTFSTYLAAFPRGSRVHVTQRCIRIVNKIEASYYFRL